MRAIDNLHPAIRNWFSGRFAAPTPCQIEAWPAILEGRHALIAAPTGSGKTLAAFIAVTIDWCAQHRGGGEPAVAGPRLGADLGRLDPEAIERLRRRV